MVNRWRLREGQWWQWVGPSCTCLLWMPWMTKRQRTHQTIISLTIIQISIKTPLNSSSMAEKTKVFRISPSSDSSFPTTLVKMKNNKLLILAKFKITVLAAYPKIRCRMDSWIGLLLWNLIRRPCHRIWTILAILQAMSSWTSITIQETSHRKLRYQSLFRRNLK